MADIDALDALRGENPRRAPTFEATVASMSATAREALSAATAGSTGAAGTSTGAAAGSRAAARSRGPAGVTLRRVGAGSPRRGGLLLLFLAVTALVAVSAVLFSHPGGSNTAFPPAASPIVVAPPSSTVPAQVPSGSPAVPTTAVPTTNPPAPIPPPAPGPSAAVATRSTFARTPTPIVARGTGDRNPASGTTTATVVPGPTTAVTLTTATTRPPAPTTVAPSLASIVPTCGVTELSAGPPERQSVTVQDTGSGLAAITGVSITNGTVSIPVFARGTEAPVVVVATKINQALPTRWSFTAVDADGTSTFCT